MFGLGHKNSALVYAAIIDISSGSVGVAVVVSDPREKLPHILYTHRSTMRVEKYTAHAAEDVRKVREAVLASSLLLSQEGYQALHAHNPKGRITELYITIASPWSHTIAKTVEYTSDDEFKVTQSMITDLIQSAETEIFSHLKSSASITPEAFNIIERTTTNVTVNDYLVRDPINLKGTVLGLTHIAGLIAKEVTTTLDEVHSKLFPSTSPHVYTYILVMYFVLQELYPRTQSFCIINITGEATELGIIEGNTLVETVSVPRGSSTFVRGVMEQTGKPATDICTIIQNSEDETTLHSVEFAPQIAAYEESLKEMFTEILEHRMLPSQVIITAGKPDERFFTKILKKSLTQVLEKEPTVINTPPAFISGIADGMENDVYLALAAHFFHKSQRTSKPE